MKISQILTHCANNSYDGLSCAAFLNRELRVPQDKWDSHITRLLPQLQNLPDVSIELKDAHRLLIDYLEKVQKALRACRTTTAQEFISFFSKECMQTQTLEQLVKSIHTILEMQSPDIAGICNVLNQETPVTYMLPYTDIQSCKLLEVPACINVNGSLAIPDINARLPETGAKWIFSSVTSNLDEDRLARRNQKNTTMTSRKKLYPVFTQIGADKLDKLRDIIPNYDETCIASLKCEIVSVFK